MKKILTILSLVGIASSAMAGSVGSGDLIVTMTVNPSCSLNTSTGIDFGTYMPMSDKTGSGTFSLLCSNGTSWTATVNAGANSGETILSRKMVNGSNNLNYNVYTDSGFSSVFGDGTTGSNITGVGNELSQNINIYGKIPSGQYLLNGSYSDNLTLTITY